MKQSDNRSSQSSTLPTEGTHALPTVRLMQQQALEPGCGIACPPCPAGPASLALPTLTEPSHAGAARHSQLIVQRARGQAGHRALQRAARWCRPSGTRQRQQEAAREQRGKVKRKEKKIMAERKAQAVVQGSQAGQKVGAAQCGHQSPLV